MNNTTKFKTCFTDNLFFIFAFSLLYFPVFSAKFSITSFRDLSSLLMLEGFLFKYFVISFVVNSLLSFATSLRKSNVIFSSSFKFASSLSNKVIFITPSENADFFSITSKVIYFSKHKSNIFAGKLFAKPVKYGLQ